MPFDWGIDIFHRETMHVVLPYGRYLHDLQGYLAHEETPTPLGFS